MHDWAAILPEGATVELREDEPTAEGWRAIAALVKAKSELDGLVGALAVLSTIASGKATVIRVAPEADSVRDFCTDETHYRGYVRFLVRDRPGRWEAMPQMQNRMRLAGFAK